MNEIQEQLDRIESKIDLLLEPIDGAPAEANTPTMDFPGHGLTEEDKQTILPVLNPSDRDFLKNKPVDEWPGFFRNHPNIGRSVTNRIHSSNLSEKIKMVVSVACNQPGKVRIR